MPHWLTGGFRPFFLLGALAMAASVLMWIPVLFGALELPTLLTPRDWHVHTVLFGAIPAVIAGFALTAVANWTGRPPVAGWTLAGLVLLWLVGRGAVTFSATLGAGLAAALDVSFLAVLSAVFAREIVASGNLRNLRVVAVVVLLGISNAAFHMEAAARGSAEVSTRAAVAVVLVLIMLIGGRIIPAFTRNWLAARRIVARPAVFSSVDWVTMAVSAAVLALWVFAPGHPVAAAGLLLAAVLNGIRLSRWCGMRTAPEPLLVILHLSYATIPLGFALTALSVLAPAFIDPVSAVHVWTVGTFGSMTLAVMARASRGHSGRPLTASGIDIAMFGFVFFGALARVFAPWSDGWLSALLHLAGLQIATAYLLFAFGYGRMLLARPRVP